MQPADLAINSIVTSTECQRLSRVSEEFLKIPYMPAEVNTL